MNCIETDKMVIAYLEGSLGDDKSQDFKKHLDGCAKCSDYVAFVRSSLDVIAIDKKVPEGTLVPGKIIEKVGPGRVIGLNRRKMLQVSAAAAVIAFAVFTGMSLGRYTSSVYLSQGNSIENDFLFAGDLSLEPIESYFIINDQEK
jgi:hypothetical protein